MINRRSNPYIIASLPKYTLCSISLLLFIVNQLIMTYFYYFEYCLYYFSFFEIFPTRFLRRSMQMKQTITNTKNTTEIKAWAHSLNKVFYAKKNLMHKSTFISDTFGTLHLNYLQGKAQTAASLILLELKRLNIESITADAMSNLQRSMVQQMHNN